jgi:ABC-type sugar transport system ATPase subunit
MAHIECRQLTKSFSDSKEGRGFRMENLDLDIPDGKVVCVLGPSGCGKSTLLKLIAGLEAPDSGQIIFDGMDMSLAPPADRRIGMVFQDYALYPNFTNRQNILSYFLFKKKTPQLEAEAEEKYRRTAELLGVDIEYLLDRMPKGLSGGEKQRVALGRCITRDPRVLLLDEPFSNLDAKLRATYRLHLKTLLARYGVTTVFVTHDQREALFLGDIIAIMREGRIEQVGSAQEIYNEPNNMFAADFLNPDPDAPAICFIPGEVLSPELRRCIVGARSEDVSIRLKNDGPTASTPDNSAGAAPSLAASVVDTRELPLGAGSLIRIRAAGRDIYVRMRKDEGPAPAPGSSILVVFKRYHLFDENTRVRVRSVGV